MIEKEIRRLRDRIAELDNKIVPQLEHRTEFLYQQILPLQEGSDERVRLEQEYAVLSKELRLRCDECLNSRHEVARLESELNTRNARPRLIRR